MGGGREGPAAQAAFRAAEMGAAVLKAAVEKLGGLKLQLEALEKLVLLPIKARSIFGLLQTSLLTPYHVLSSKNTSRRNASTV